MLGISLATMEFTWPEKTELEKTLEGMPRKILDWFFFYRTNNMIDKTLHIVDVIAILYLLVRLVMRG